MVSGAGPTLRLPYLYFVGDGVPYNAYPVRAGGFITGPNTEFSPLAFQVIDRYGAPVTNLPVLFSVTSGGGRIVAADRTTDRTGIAAVDVKLGPALGDQYFTATIPNGPSVIFDGYARNFPAINSNGVTDAATFQVGQGLAPGSYITIKGTDLADATQVESTASLPVSLSGVSVSFDGGSLSLPGHLHFVSPGQINVQVPWEFQGQSSVKLKVNAGYLLSSVYTVPLATYSPGIFEYSDNGRKSAVAQDAGFNLITQANPAKRGQGIVLYCNGLGPVSNQPASGEASPAGPLAKANGTATVTIGGANAQVDFAGMTPGTIGLYQVNVTVPANAPTGNQQIVVSIGGVSSQISSIAVQ